MPYAKKSGAVLYYKIHGKGEPLLFLSGTGGTLSSPFTVFNSPLAESFMLVSYDHRGQGKSSSIKKENKEGSFSISDYTEDAITILDELGWDSCFVAGASFGGMVAQHLAVTCPDRVRKLVLACTSGGGADASCYPIEEFTSLSPPERAEELVKICDTRDGEKWSTMDQVEKDLKVRQAMFLNLVGAGLDSWRGDMEIQLEARKKHDVTDLLHQCSMPVFICGGIYDGICPPHTLQTLHESITHADYRLYRGGHFFMSDDPRAYRDIVNFLKE